MNPHRNLRMAMVGGGRDAFIGAVHRMAARLDGSIDLVAGALSSTPEKSLASGRDLGLADHRNYPAWRDLIAGELALPPGDRVDFVSIVTPNASHFEIAHACISAGFHVVLDKPMVLDSAQATQLITAVDAHRRVLAVTYNYTGYPLVRQARHMVAAGELGTIRKVIVEYNQGWLAAKLEQTGQKQADWRTDPARAGLGGALGDIGSHAENLASFITGLTIQSICADLTAFVPGRRLDDDANLLLRFTNGARGILFASQISIGHENDLRIRVMGDKASLQWHQEQPNHLVFKPHSKPDQVLRRGNDYLCDDAKAATRLPPGHPEAFIEAFANIYRNAAADIRAAQGLAPAANSPAKPLYPTVRDGARGVRFIETTVASAHSDAKWTPFINP